jgi:hypothetical protein
VIVWSQRERNLRLRGRLDLLLGENEALHMKVADLKVRPFQAANLRRVPAKL